MARREKTSPAENIMDLVAMLPWWVSVLALFAEQPRNFGHESATEPHKEKQVSDLHR